MSSPESLAGLPTQVASLDIHTPPAPAPPSSPPLSPPPPTPPLTRAHPAPHTNTPATTALRTLLRHTLRLTLADGRVFLGTFAGTDKRLNVLLVNADEFTPKGADGRFVGLVQVPWALVVKAEVHRLEAGGGHGAFGHGGPGGGMDGDAMGEGVEDGVGEAEGVYYS